MLKNLIIKWDEKPWYEALGLHHAGLTLAVMLAMWSIFGFYGAFFGWAFMCGVYFYKELRENGDKFEILDFITPLIMGGLIC